MDEKTLRYLKSIRPEQKDLKKLFVKKDVYKEEKEAFQQALENGVGTKDQREYMRNTLKNPAINRKSLVLDEDTAKEIERKTEEKIKHAIKSGKIKEWDRKSDKFADKILKSQGL